MASIQFKPLSELVCESSSNPGYVYVLFNGENYKIGKTKNLKSRKSSIQTGSDTNLKILAYAIWEDYSLLERSIQKAFKRYKKVREWFSLPEEELQPLLDYLKDADNLFKYRLKEKQKESVR